MRRFYQYISENISVTHGCIRFTDSFRFLSSSLDSLVKTPIDNKQKTLKNLKKEIVDDNIPNIVNEIETLKSKDRKNDSIEDLKKDLTKEIDNLEALNNFISGNHPKILKDEFPDKWNYMNKSSAYPYEYFNSIDDFQKPVNKFKKEDCFSKLKNDFPNDEQIKRTKEIIKLFNIRNVEELTKSNLRSDVILFTCVFEKLTKKE